MSHREHEAWEARYKHANASRAWDAIATENEGAGKSAYAAECRILAEWMAAYQEADAKAEQAFRSLPSERPAE